MTGHNHTLASSFLCQQQTLQWKERFLLCDGSLNSTNNTHTAVSRPFVWDYSGEPIPEETFTHSHPWGRWRRKILTVPTTHTHTHTHPFNGPFPGLPGWAGTRKVKPVCILQKQETVSSSGISSAICKSAPRSRQITTPVPHHSVFTSWMPFLLTSQQHQSNVPTRSA